MRLQTFVLLCCLATGLRAKTIVVDELVDFSGAQPVVVAPGLAVDATTSYVIPWG